MSPHSLCTTLLIAALSGLGSASAFGQSMPTPRPSTAPEEPLTLLPEPRLMTAAVHYLASKYFRDGGEEAGRDGLYLAVGNMPNGAGWLALGPGYRYWFLDKGGLIDVSAAVSMRLYKTAQMTIAFPQLGSGRFAVGSQILWQDLTQLSYYGIDLDLPAEELQSAYRLRTTDAVGFAAYHPADRVTVRGEAGWVARPTLSSPTGPFDRGYPDSRARYPADPGFEPEQQPAFTQVRLSVDLDTRDNESHPHAGGLFRAAWGAYAGRDRGPYGFQQYEGEALQFVPLIRASWTLAFHGWMVATDPIDDRAIPVYLMPTLGGASTLRSFSSYRFHGNHLLLFSAESRVALLMHVDAAAFVDAGNVTTRFRDLDLDHKSYGVGLRLHSHTSTIARFDVAHGRDGWNFLFRLNDPFRLNRLSKLTAMIPFVP